jgi:hypothetical protein
MNNIIEKKIIIIPNELKRYIYKYFNFNTCVICNNKIIDYYNIQPFTCSKMCYFIYNIELSPLLLSDYSDKLIMSVINITLFIQYIIICIIANIIHIFFLFISALLVLSLIFIFSLIVLTYTIIVQSITLPMILLKKID